MKNIAISAIKNNATLFSSDDFIKSRRVVEAFRDAWANRLREANCKLVGLQMRHISFPATFWTESCKRPCKSSKPGRRVQKNVEHISRGDDTPGKEIENDAFEIRSCQSASETGEEKAANEAKELEEASRSMA